MSNYWIVVPRGNRDLLALVSVAFRGHTGFSVVIDRRGADPSIAQRDGVAGRMPLGPDEIVVAERSDGADQARAASNGDDALRSFSQVPVRRRRARRPAVSSERPGALRPGTLRPSAC
jgi:hypothetical protein